MSECEEQLDASEAVDKAHEALAKAMQESGACMACSGLSLIRIGLEMLEAADVAPIHAMRRVMDIFGETYDYDMIQQVDGDDATVH